MDLFFLNYFSEILGLHAISAIIGTVFFVASFVSLLSMRVNMSRYLFLVAWIAIGTTLLAMCIHMLPSTLSFRSSTSLPASYYTREVFSVQKGAYNRILGGIEGILFTLSLGILLTFPILVLDKIIRTNKKQRTYGIAVCVLVGILFILIEILRFDIRVAIYFML